MPRLRTVRVRKDWLEEAIEREGGMTPLAKKLRISVSTISRYMSDGFEAGPRFIAAVLSEYPVTFHDVFDVVEEPTRGHPKDTARAAA